MENLGKMPKLIINKWHWVAEEGFPEDECEWCLLMYRGHDGEDEVLVGSYYEEKNEFYVNFGLGGLVMDAESVVGWASLEDCTWEL